MRNIVRLRLVFLTLISLISPKILAVTEIGCRPYVGGDIQIRKMPFKRGFGDDLFKQESVQGNFYLGFKINNNFGLEIGHQVADKKDRNTLTSTEPRLGTTQNVPTGLREAGTRQIKGWNLNLVGFLPVSTEYKTSLIGIVGISSLEVRLKDQLILAVAPGANVQREVKFKQRKNVLRLGGGVQKMVSDSFGVRATVVWENTSRFNNIAQNYAGRTYTAKIKDSWTYGIGAFVMF